MTKKKLQIMVCILLFTTGLGLGMAIGYKHGKNQIPAQQTSIQIKDIKTKKGGEIHLHTETDQEQENKGEKRKRFLGLF
ncbi:hypothetical protein L3073_06010 [Ancylomarina sp. DW003]|nr:hypothetical protein [Ancylomarina sp. DW003]MDE5421755.1 hypothetical protein [Ancylomarina sp. DW003]